MSVSAIVMEALSSRTLFLLLICSTFAVKGIRSRGTPPPAGDWTVPDSQGNPCMRMSFAAQYVISSQPPQYVNIPPSSRVSGPCASPSRTVDFYPDYSSSSYKLQLRFKLNGTQQIYALTKVLASWPDSGSSVSFSVEKESYNFLENAVPTGKSYSCDKLTVDLGGVMVHMWDVHLQPFAEISNGDYGPGLQCGQQPTTSDPTIIIIICSVVGSVILIGIIVTVTAVIVIKHRRRMSAYAHTQG